MGKLVLVIAAAAIFANSMLLLNVDDTSVATSEKQSDRQAQVIAREIARTGKNIMLSKARKLQRQNPDIALENIVEMVNGGKDKVVSESFGGGTFEARVRLTSAATFAVESVGRYMLSEHNTVTQRVEQVGILGEGTLEITEPSKLHVEFLESMAGYCSAIYLQRMIPATGSTGEVVYHAQTPELVFVPGNNRDNSSVSPQDIILNAGERVNFILAVDADYSCERRDMVVPVSDPSFNYTRKALLTEVGTEIETLQEGDYAMIQENPNYTGVWRIAFEDLIFDEEKLVDVKEFSYGNKAWNGETFGGNGWKKKDSRKYWKLENHGDRPDFSDQVIQIGFVPIDEEADWDGWDAFTNNGHGNNDDGTDSSNPGQGDGGPHQDDESCDDDGCIDDESARGNDDDDDDGDDD